VIWIAGSPAGENGRALLDNALAASRWSSVRPVWTWCAASSCGFLDKQAVPLAADPGDDGRACAELVTRHSINSGTGHTG
jgi:hypothetical protein